MNYTKKTLIYFVFHTVIGLIAMLFAFFGNLPDGYREGVMSGIAGGFVCTGVLGIIFSFRILKNPQRTKAVEISKNEERTQLIRMKTHSAVFTVMLYVESIGTLVAGLMGLKEISILLAIVLLFQFTLYIGFANYYWKKY